MCNSATLSESSQDKVTGTKPPTSSIDVTGLLTPTSPCTTPQVVTTCMLKTTVAPAVAGNRKKSANILLVPSAPSYLQTLSKN